ncbi:MAG: sulfate adenylyltransferase [Betaproteobacteria bacterium RIFCSPLOWO2_12_FULL_63_13]|nr:MAG: sulfate adenylyltransferase [Betaproteobacteria bacterium RIFCSPLOWO2_12_FULL_63_13]
MSLLGEIERDPARAQPAYDGVLRFVTAGSVDDGKSTLIGRLLLDSRAILVDQLAAVERASRRRGGDQLDLSLLTDGLEAEREQGITIDVAYRYFATPRRKFIIADCPGHEQYTRNMVTAASTADAAVILVDARKGILPQTRRHLAIAHLLGIRHFLVAVNKMDLVGYDRRVFDAVRAELNAFAAPLAIHNLQFVPISALHGDFVVERSASLPWYEGATLIELLERIHEEDIAAARPLRFPVQLVSRPGAAYEARGYMGRIDSGSVAPGSEVRVLPSGRTSVVTHILAGGRPADVAVAGDAVTLQLRDELDVSRGDMLADPVRTPVLTKAVNALLCWFSVEPLSMTGRYLLKHRTRTVRARVTALRARVDIHALGREPVSGSVALNDIVQASLSLNRPIFCDAYRDDRASGSFILIDELTNQTVAAGLIE